MSNFKVFDSEYDIRLSKNWDNATHVSYEIKCVNERGQEVDSTWKGRKYQRMTIERNFACWEKAGRRFLGVLAVCFTLGLAILSKTVQELFTKKKETLHFGIRVLDDTNTPKIPVSKIRSISIGKFCMQSSPCQHNCLILLTDGEEKFLRFDAIEIKQLIQKIPEKIRNTWSDSHFLSQNRTDWPENPHLAFDQ